MKVFGVLFLMVIVFVNISFSQTQSADTVIYEAVEYDAEFPREYGDISKWLSANFKLPDDLNKSEWGKIMVSFIVEINGSITHIKIVKGLSERLNTSVIKMIEQMPKWKPGTLNDKPVRSRFKLPIQINISN